MMLGHDLRGRGRTRALQTARIKDSSNVMADMVQCARATRRAALEPRGAAQRRRRGHRPGDQRRRPGLDGSLPRGDVIEAH